MHLQISVRQYVVTSRQSTVWGFTLNCSYTKHPSNKGLPPVQGEVTINRIVYIDMDVHSQSFSLCALEPSLGAGDRFFAESKVQANPRNVVKYIERLRKNLKYEDCRFITGYEVGCLGFSLYNAHTGMGIECVILAPSTMSCPKGGRRVKTDKRDARNIAGCLAY